MNPSIRHSEEICNRLREKFTSLIPEKYMRHIVSVLIAVFCIGYRGKTVNIALHSDHHRTTISRFLRNENRNDAPLTAAMKAFVISIIYDESRRSGKPILVIIDDTISSKTGLAGKDSGALFFGQRVQKFLYVFVFHDNASLFTKVKHIPQTHR